jgi:dTDP-4-dehydrorhamnose reductase
VGRDSSVHVTGAGGQVGFELRALLPQAHFWARKDLDVTAPDQVAARLEGAGTVVHLAAVTNVDECELEPERAFSVNGTGTANVVAAAARRGGRVVYVSTDYVFDGQKEGEYVESDRTAPVNRYGASKLEGERHVLAEPGNLVIRTSWVFGHGRNFIDTIVAATRAGRAPTVVDDQIGRPTWARDLATAIVYLDERNESGLVHVAGDGSPCSWADLAEVALTAAGSAVPVTRADTATYRASVDHPIAPRPSNSALALDKARALGVPLSHWRNSVHSYVTEAS